MLHNGKIASGIEQRGRKESAIPHFSEAQGHLLGRASQFGAQDVYMVLHRSTEAL